VHLLDQFASVVIYISFVALPFFLFSVATRRFLRVSASLFLGPILISFLATQIIITIVRANALTLLNGGEDAVVSINETTVADPAPILNALRSMALTSAHHLHTTNRLHVVIRTKKGNLSLDLGRDSDRPREYWVFYPGYRSIRENDIARFVSNALDTY
jgi:hypothetical protein